MRDRFGIFGTVARIRKLSTFGNDVKNTQHSFAVSKLSRFVSNPGDIHWQALERVMRYLKGTVSYDIHYTGYPKVLEGYCDANWISDADVLKATSGYVFLLGGGAVS